MSARKCNPLTWIVFRIHHMSVSHHLHFVSDRLQGFFTVVPRTFMKVSTLEFNTISDAMILGVLTLLELCNEIFTGLTQKKYHLSTHTRNNRLSEETNTVCRSLRNENIAKWFTWRLSSYKRYTQAQQKEKVTPLSNYSDNTSAHSQVSEKALIPTQSNCAAHARGGCFWKSIYDKA